MLNIESFRDYCLNKKAVTEGFPFDENVLVFKVMDKIFALTDVNEFEYVNLRCPPDYAATLREQFDGVRPGYHMNKSNWNSVYTQSDVDEKLFYELVDLSYQSIVESLPKKLQRALEEMP